MHMPKCVTVAELTRLTARLLEREFPLMWVQGEVSNLVRATSGHFYFVLKDRTSAVRAVMFRQKAAACATPLRDGMQVQARVLVTLYEPRGEFQVTVEAIQPVGAGALFEAYIRLRDQLASEGLFEAARKRALPSYCTRIGLLTSPTGAAVRDVVTTLKRRAPQVEVVLFPSAVQGAGAVPQLLQALEQARQFPGLDLLIVCRGGGSIEDLWPFNDELFIRALARFEIPIISGVGHETDVTLTDLVADLRAATPTAAAELACPARADLLANLDFLTHRMKAAVDSRLEGISQRLDRAALSLVPPTRRIALFRQHLHALAGRQGAALLTGCAKHRYRLQNEARRLTALRYQMDRWQRILVESIGHLRRTAEYGLAQRRHGIELMTARLNGLNPLSVMSRGFSLVLTEEGVIVRSVDQVDPAARLRIKLPCGELRVTVDAKTPPEELP